MLGSLLLLVALGNFFPVAVPGPAAPTLVAAAVSLPGLASSAPTSAVGSIGSAPVPLTVVSAAVRSETVGGTPAPQSSISSRLSSSTPGGSTAIGRDQGLVPLFYRYEVKQGDTVSSIAAKHGVATQYIVWNNVEVIDDDNLLRPGQLLQVPTIEGIIHAVRLGETLTEIADHYEARVEDIIAFPANNLGNPNDLKENGMILVPGGKITPRPAPTLRPERVEAAAAGAPAPASAAAPAAPVAPAASVGWVWPVQGLITSYFGPSHPLGIDINAPYVPVKASGAGQVVFAGGDSCCSYGYYIEVQHPGGYSTRYAHLSAFAVSLGQFVEQGQVIGTSGNTGNSTGPHLHFEMRRNGQIVNPSVFLP